MEGKSRVVPPFLGKKKKIGGGRKKSAEDFSSSGTRIPSAPLTHPFAKKAEPS